MNNETIILINEEESKDGYFSFGTSLERNFKRLCRRVGGKGKLIEVRESRTKDGKTNWWECKVALKYLSKSHFGVRKCIAERSSEGEKVKSGLDSK